MFHLNYNAWKVLYYTEDLEVNHLLFILLILQMQILIVLAAY